jgi:hypothetical protein
MPPERGSLGALHPIGNRRAAALVGPDASIRWWTPQRIEDGGAFFRLVDPAGGCVELALRGMTRSWTERDDTAPVMRTTMQSPDGVVVVEDHLADGRHGFANGTIVRLISAQSGLVTLDATVVGGSRFSRARRTYRSSDSVAWVSTELGGAAMAVRGIDGHTPQLSLRSGEAAMITITADATDQRIRREEYERHLAELRRTWRYDLDNPFDGPLRNNLRAWFQQLLLLVNIDTGALMRAFSTSLPSQIGSERQIDERLAYLDDAARFVRLCERLDRPELAEPTRRWIADALSQSGTRARRSDGSDPDREIDLMLPGWLGHQPVRNSDVGAASLSLADLSAASLVLDANRDRRVITSTANRIARALEEPNEWDGGRWAGRVAARRKGTPPQPTPWVSSVLAARSALRAAATTERRHDPLSVDAAEWHRWSKHLDSWLRANGTFGVAAAAGWRRAVDDDSSDAQLLRWIASPDPSDGLPELPDDGEGEARARVSNAINQHLAQLDDHGLSHRHLPHADDGFAPGQGADVAASAELVSALCRLGRWDEAHARMEFLQLCLASGSDGAVCVPSHVDPRNHAHLGNRPYAPALLAMCEAALILRGGPA